MKISIIIGFKDREIGRIKKCIESLARQTYHSFELIFIDYGSGTALAKEAKAVVNDYDFAQYIYSNVGGMFWNRSHALNSGIAFASGELILFADIDLVFEPGFLAKLAKLDTDHAFYTFNCFYMPNGYDPSGKSMQQILKDCVENYVGLCAVQKKALLSINGFDEYYMVWGIEDDDLYERLESAGYKKHELKAAEFTSYHQWHASHYERQPSYWYVTMVQYLFNKTKRITDTIGNIYKPQDRPCIEVYLKGTWADHSQLTLYRDQHYLYHPFYVGFNKLQPGEFGYYSLLKEEKSGGRLMPVIDKVNKLAAKIPAVKYELVSVTKKETTEQVAKNLTEFIAHFIGTCREQVADYYFENTKGSLLLILQKK